MCIKVVDEIKDFLEDFSNSIGERKRDVLLRYLTAIIMGDGKRTLKSFCTTILTEQRCKTTAGKALRRKRFHTRNIHQEMIRGLIANIVKYFGKSGEWVLLIDGTATRRGALTKIQNGIKYREKKSSAKGWSTKAHLFVMGLLIAPNGYRIPFTRYTYYSRSFCKKHGMKHVSQIELAAMMVAELRSYLPYPVKIAVIADAFFDSKSMFQACRENRVVFITPADRARKHIHIFRYHENLHQRGRDRKMKDFRTFRIVKGDEQWTRFHLRPSNQYIEGKIKHLYRVMGEKLNVSGLGDTRVVFSHKSKSGKKWTGSKSFMVLLCSDPDWDERKIVEYYALRWQIEIFFRELKSDLGLGDFSGQDFRAFERFVDLCLMSFAFLEWYRMMRMRSTRSRKEQGKLQIMRTRGLKSILKEEQLKELRQYIFTRKSAVQARKVA